MTQQILQTLIAFEGPDGIGKTKQSGLLVDWLNNNYDNRRWDGATYYKELNETNHIYKSFRQLVYNLYKQVSTKILADIIKINRYVLQEEIVKHMSEDKDDDVLYIVDRWNISTYNYVISDPSFNIKCINDVIIAASYLDDKDTYIPGLTIMLVGMNGVNRQANRSDNNNMFEDVDLTYKQRLAHSYIDFDTSLYAGKVVKINNDNMTVEQTHQVIKEEVINYLDSL